MYISKIKIHNYRNFKDLEIDYNDGINIIIGHNNAGKSNLLRALSIFFDSNTNKSLEVNDFNKYIPLEKLKAEPPEIIISLTINQSKEENLMSDDLVTVSTWLTKLEETYEAQLTYEFLLPYKEHDHYKKMVKDLNSTEEIWKLINDEFIRLYNYKIWCGNPTNQVTAERESLQKFDFQFLDAIRDVERDMFTGRNTLLKDVLDFFIDYKIKSNTKLTEDERVKELKKEKQEFCDDADTLLHKLQKRMDEGKIEILSYVEDVGASFDKSSPDFAGSISETELYSTLKLIIEYETGMKIPISHNGLGYNNLIFMALLLAKMQVNSDGKYLGSNAKVFPVLAIEEPEAHLHPSMQYQFLKFLSKNKKQKKVRQIFITTHSTHITASCSLDEIICLYKKGNESYVGYPRRVFPDDKSKKYVQRFLDSTKSDMLFADKVILVEGIAEQLLLSVFAKYLGKSLEENHVAVINVGGRHFEYFLHLFNTQENEHSINRKVACLTDYDPERKLKKDNDKFKKCYPFEYNVQGEKYEFQHNTHLNDYIGRKHSNIRAFTQDENYGKTFEYELALNNPSLELLITNSLKNKDEIRNLMEAYKEGKNLSEFEKLLYLSEENKRIFESLNEVDNKTWKPDDKKRALIAARYLNSVDKGENALELAYSLQENLERKDEPEYQNFKVPGYIKDTIDWVCK